MRLQNFDGRRCLIRCAAGQDLGNKTLSSLATALLTAKQAIDSLPQRPRSISRGAPVNAREAKTARPMQGSTARATTLPTTTTPYTGGS